MSDNYFLDSNVILYALGNDIAKKHQAQALINKKALISTQVLTEISNVCLKKFKLSPESVSQWIGLLNTETQVQQISGDTIIQAIQYAKLTQYSFYDSLIITSAINAGANILYSEDMQHGRTIQHLKIINPFI